ncbi:MAG TPA: GGDEF domain-containing protein [Candidatus Dormibacteraeota bacterium]|nr:GGDEF domain-containing protein [Candidatus Dormibacteraeota bacterium]
MGEHVERSGREAVAVWLGVPAAAVEHVSDEIIEAITARMAGLPPPASVLRDELLDLMKGAADRFRQEAETDLLTGLPNRRAFERRLRSELGRRSGDHNLALLILDVDGFKAVNDRFGHAAGDVVLREVGARLRAGVRGGDLVARWGGDEFMVLCREVREDAAAAIACKLGRLIEIPVALDRGEVRVSASIGWAVAVPGHASADLLAAADAAMYRAKPGQLS